MAGACPLCLTSVRDEAQAEVERLTRTAGTYRQLYAEALVEIDGLREHLEGR